MLNYFISPQGSPLLLFGGVLLVVHCRGRDGLSQTRDHTKDSERTRYSDQPRVRRADGLFYPLVAKAITGDHSVATYTVAFFFASGTALCAVPVNYFLMRKPLTGGQPVSMDDYWKGRAAGIGGEFSAELYGALAPS